MQGLKALVIFMGVLIVIGMGGLAYGLVAKFGGDKKPEISQASVVPAIEAPVVKTLKNGRSPMLAFGDVDALLPTGAEIIEFIPNKRLLLIVYKSTDGARAIKVVNVANGNDMGTIHLDKAQNDSGTN